MKKKDSRVIIFDTTLRDGEQSPGASLNTEQKLEVARQLAALRVDVIEAGFPISSPGDLEAVSLVAQEVRGPIIAGLARAMDDDVDAAWEGVKSAGKPRIHTFIATSDIHLEHKLHKTREQVLDMAVAAVKRAKGYCDDVEFSPEDASRSDRQFLAQVVEAVIEAGATTVNIPDTVGYAIPEEFGDLIAWLRENVPNMQKATLSVHCHNDLGLATANSLAAVRHGARQVECTINGLGERAGNASLEEVVMALRTRHDALGFETGIDTTQIYRASRLVSDLTGIPVQPNKAIVGANAFAHEAGIHQHGVMQEKLTYEIMDAAAIGLTESRLVLGKHSGRHAFERKLTELGYQLSREELNRAFARFKELADKKKEISDRDIESVIADEIYTPPETYHLDYVHVIAGSAIVPSATVRLTSEAEGEEIVKSGTGVGAIDAIYKTILAAFQSKLHGRPRLVDFNIKSVTGGTDALAEVTVKVADREGRTFTGRASSMDTFEASAKAYVQVLNKLVHHSQG